MTLICHNYRNGNGLLPLECGAEVHHILPAEDGVDNNPKNLITVCHACHAKRHKIIPQKAEIKFSMHKIKRLKRLDIIKLSNCNKLNYAK